jgi:hypothetical protein
LDSSGDGSDAAADLYASGPGVGTQTPQNEGDSKDVDENKRAGKNASGIMREAPEQKTHLKPPATGKNAIVTAAAMQKEAASPSHP